MVLEIKFFFKLYNTQYSKSAKIRRLRKLTNISRFSLFLLLRFEIIGLRLPGLFQQANYAPKDPTCQIVKINQIISS